jgi:hypothetical protein
MKDLTPVMCTFECKMKDLTPVMCDPRHVTPVMLDPRHALAAREASVFKQFRRTYRPADNRPKFTLTGVSTTL